MVASLTELEPEKGGKVGPIVPCSQNIYWAVAINTLIHLFFPTFFSFVALLGNDISDVESDTNEVKPVRLLGCHFDDPSDRFLFSFYLFSTYRKYGRLSSDTSEQFLKSALIRVTSRASINSKDVYWQSVSEMKRLIRSEASLLLAGVFCEFYKKFA